MLELDLQRFAEGGGEGGSSAAPDAATGGDFQADAALEQYRQKRFPGKAKQQVETQAAPEVPPAEQEAGVSPAPEDRKQAFRDLIKGDYKAEAGEWVEGLIKERFKNQTDAKDELDKAKGQLDKLQPLLEALYQQNGVKKGDLDALIKQVTNDDALYEDEALQRGIPVETLKEMKAFQREAEALKAQVAEQEERQFYERHLQGLFQQGESLRQLYPNFDLKAELGNPEFARLTSPSVGLDVRTAFEVVHRDELEPMKAEAIRRKVSEDMSRAYLSGSKRPAENGISGGSAAVTLSDDPSKWDKSTLRRIVNDVKGGRKIRL